MLNPAIQAKWNKNERSHRTLALPQVMSPRSPRSLEDAVTGELPVLYRIARRLVSSDAEAEDLVGQTLLKAARAWHRFDGAFVRSWLISILRNENISNFRKRSQEPSSLALEESDAVTDDVWDTASWHASGPEILAALDSLPPDYRMVVVLCDVEELSYDEAAEAMGVPVGTIRSRLFRARRLLRDKLSSLMEES